MKSQVVVASAFNILNVRFNKNKIQLQKFISNAQYNDGSDVKLFNVSIENWQKESQFFSECKLERRWRQDFNISTELQSRAATGF